MSIQEALLQVHSNISSSPWGQRSTLGTPLPAYSAERAARLITDAKNTAAFVLVHGKGVRANSRLDFLLTAVNAAHIQSER